MNDEISDNGMLGDFIGEDALAEELHVTKRTLARYRHQADGLPFAVIGGRILYPREAVRQWIARKVVHPNSRRRT